MNCIRSFRNIVLLVLYFKIQFYDKVFLSLFLRGRLLKEVLFDKNDGELVLILMSEEYVDEVEVAILSDDDVLLYFLLIVLSVLEFNGSLFLLIKVYKYFIDFFMLIFCCINVFLMVIV